MTQCTGDGCWTTGRGALSGVDDRPERATISDSSFSALICSVTARRIALVDSLASTGRSRTPFLSSARVCSSSPRMLAAVLRISSVAVLKRFGGLLDDFGDGAAHQFGRLLRAALGRLEHAPDDLPRRPA